MEDRLISLIISRVYQELPINKGKIEFRRDELALQNERALIELSPFKLSYIVNGVIQLIDKIFKSPQMNAELVSKSHLMALELIVNCLSSVWDHIRAQFSNLSDVKDDLERIRIKEKEEAILPPPLEDRVSKELFKILHYFVSKPQPAFQNEIQEIAAKGLYQISASNYETIISSVTQYFSPNINCSEEEIISQISLLEYFNLNAKHLSEFLMKLGKVLSSFKKLSIQITIASVLRKVIWNWINRYPFEFVTLCQSGTRLPGNPENIFDIFESWASSTSKRINFWPVCTMLLILCPDLMLRIIVNPSQVRKEDQSKDMFLQNLQKSLKNSKLADIATVCYIDICKASTFVSKSDISALRFIIPAIETELKERIFSSGLKSDSLIDEGLAIDFLHSAFLLSPRKAMNSVFYECTKPGATAINKRVLVRTLLRIGTDQHSLPWNPTLTDGYSLQSGNLRQLFQDLLSSVREYSVLINSSDKKSKQQLEKVIIDLDILEKLITLYKVDPLLSFYPSKVPDLEEIRLLFMGLCECVVFFHLPTLSEKAYETLLELFRPDYIERWYPKDPNEGCWLISSSVNSYLSSILIDQMELEQTQIQRVFMLLEQILRKKNQFLESFKDAIPTESTKRIRSQASTKLEIALLIHFCSGNTEIVSTSANCLSLLCAEVDLTRQYIDELDNSLLSNFDAYKRLGNAGILSTGRQAQQKAIRTALKRVDRSTAGNYAAWEAVFHRWQMYTTVLLIIEESIVDNKQLAKQKEEARRKGIPKSFLEKSHSDVLQEWNNFLGLLCSLSAATINQDLKNKLSNNKSSTDQLLETFINELMDYLVSDFLSVRETVKMTLGNALSPSTFPVLFQVLHAHAKNIFGKDGQGNFTANSILFVDQAVSILKLIIESDFSSDHLSLFTTDFEDLIHTLVRFVRQLTITVNSLQTKHKFCGLLEGIMGKSTLLTFRNEYKFRSNLIENIMEWTSEFSTKESNIPQDLPSATHKQIVKLIKELDVQVLQAIAALIRALPLQGKDDEEKSNAFSKIFSFFTNLLTRCKKNPQSVLTPQLPEATIQSLSFLVTANIEHGLEYFVTMGYHEDHETRSAFLKVLTNILNEGTDFDMQAVSLNKYYKLTELIFEPSLEVILNVCDNIPITEADAMAALLIRIFESNEKTMDLLKQTIIQEVNRTDSANTLFRRNSMATKLMAAYCKLIGREYLRLTLGPILRDLQQQPLPSELNPSLLPQGQDLATNQKNVQMICSKFLDAIHSSISHCTLPFREICNFLKTIVSEKFPGAEQTAIAGFLFLRFLCPAIVAPDGFGVISGDLQDKELRRCLVIVTKILQNLANRCFFIKEPYMECNNGFIESNLPLMNKILDEYSTIPDDAEAVPPITFTEEQLDEDMGRLHYFISITLEKLSNNWVGKSGSALFDKLTSVLSQLGPPPEPSSKTNAYTAVSTAANNSKNNQNIHYQQFLNRLSKVDTDNPRFKEIFYHHGKSKKGLPVLYYIARNFSAELDTEHLFFYLLKTSQQFLSQPYCLIIDLSMFSTENQIQIPWCGTFAKIFPDFGSVNLDCIYIVHPNNWFKKYSKSISKFVSRQHKKITFCPTISKLYDYISESECGLPPDTLSLENSVNSTFSHVIKEGKYSRKEVVIRISTDLLQVITTKQYSIFNHPTSVIDLIHVSTISEASPIKENQFLVKFNVSGKRSLLLISLSAEQILQQLNASLDRYRLLHQNSQPKRKAFRPSDVPGTLLNMALLNLTVLSHSLRIAAYNLLVSLCQSFQFSIPTIFLEASDIAIPKNRRDFIVRVSGELAKSETHLTLEFLLESLHSIPKADHRSKVLILDYIKPWISNLSSYCNLVHSPESAVKVSKTKEIINELLEIHEHDDQLAPDILTKTWKTISTLPELIELSLVCIFERCINLKNPYSSKFMDVAEDIVITLASNHLQLVAGKTISSLLSVFKDHNNNNNFQLLERMENSPTHWVKIEVYIRILLILSCENLVCVEVYLPELFFIILVTFFSGNTIFRSNVHSLFMNIVHSIFSSCMCPEEKLQTLRFHFNDFHQLQNRLHFGIGSRVDSPFEKSLKVLHEKLETMPISMVENVTTNLLNVLNCCTKNTTSLDTPRYSRWLSLVTVAAFSSNLAIQPRAISALGVLLRSPSLITEDLISNLLILLRGSLMHWSIKENMEDMPTSIINCLSRIYEHIDTNSKYHTPLFWLSVTLIQIHDPKIFSSSVALLESIIHTMFEKNLYKGHGLSAFAMETRNGPWKPMLDKLDQLSGISFDHNFSFALAGHLLKGLKNSTTKAVTTRVLSSIVNLCRENNPSNILGFLSALLPIKGDDVGNLRQTIMAASGEAGNSQTLFNPSMIPDKMHGALLFTFLVTILKNSDFEHEQHYIYKTLEEGIGYMPDAFPVTFEVLIPKMQQLLNSSQNSAILYSILSITQSIFHFGLDVGTNYSQLTKEYLRTIGFSGLLDNDQFHYYYQKNKTAFIQVVGGVIDSIMGDETGHQLN